MEFFTSNAILPYLISAGIAILFVVGTISIMFFINDAKKTKSYDDQLKELIEDEYYKENDAKVTLVFRWSSYWGRIFKEAGFSRYEEDSSNAGRDAFLIFLLVGVVVSVISGNPLIGIPAGAAALWVISAALKWKGTRKSEEINNQLPGFLFALKANIQARETPENALLKVVDGMPSPLYDDLIIVKEMLLARSTLTEALRVLSQKTASRDLKFLAACMIQASGAGADLENQITVIQNVLVERKKITDEIDKAVRAALPSIYVATLLIPGSFIVSYLFDSTSKSFWFVNPISWIALTVVALLYIMAIYLSKKLVDSIKNM